ncbi:unnamed protein product [Cyprideis torosa]|uniref:Uncharacterized protein n=1 Tax=Cyprideis torosa TaxID=163714 RepID=A0A7R8ZU90_9CRUS|nr:unnamed protein product [Cyprideis torosa]CAG0899858.1 unnamed protein product [Cyprideis torosa]
MLSTFPKFRSQARLSLQETDIGESGKSLNLPVLREKSKNGAVFTDRMGEVSGLSPEGGEGKRNRPEKGGTLPLTEPTGAAANQRPSLEDELDQLAQKYNQSINKEPQMMQQRSKSLEQALYFSPSEQQEAFYDTYDEDEEHLRDRATIDEAEGGEREEMNNDQENHPGFISLGRGPPKLKKVYKRRPGVVMSASTGLNPYAPSFTQKLQTSSHNSDLATFHNAHKISLVTSMTEGGVVKDVRPDGDLPYFFKVPTPTNQPFQIAPGPSPESADNPLTSPSWLKGGTLRILDNMGDTLPMDSPGREPSVHRQNSEASSPFLFTATEDKQNNIDFLPKTSSEYDMMHASASDVHSSLLATLEKNFHMKISRVLQTFNNNHAAFFEMLSKVTEKVESNQKKLRALTSATTQVLEDVQKNFQLIQDELATKPDPETIHELSARIQLLKDTTEKLALEIREDSIQDIETIQRIQKAEERLLELQLAYQKS